MRFTLLFLILSGCLQESNLGSRKTVKTPEATATATSTACTSKCDERPDADIKINHTFCACEKGLPVMVGNCSATCALTNDTTPTLYLTFTPGIKTLSNNFTLKTLGNIKEPLKTTKRWCTIEIDDGLTGTGCALVATDGTNTLTLQPTTMSDNAATFNISNMTKGRTWVFTLAEASSGAKTDVAQLIRAKDTAFTPTGPLKVRPIAEYSCLTRIGTPGSTGSPPSVNNTYDNLARLHFYFTSGATANALPATANGYNVCHDFQSLGSVDNSSFLRNELIDHIFAVWDPKDPRFSATGTGSAATLPINTEIKDRLLREYNVTADIKIFSAMTWPDTLILSDGSNPQPSTPTLGVIMQAWINADTLRPFCPTATNFESGQAVFRILKDYVSDTEGLYLAQREAKTYTDKTGTIKLLPNDFILIREGLLKKIWFYFDNGVLTIPNAITAGQKTIQFYWPPSFANPYLRQSQQELFTIKHPSEISGLSGSTGSASTLPADKRFACVPVKGKEGE